MGIQRVVGFIVLAGGVVLIILGITASRSLGNQLTNLFTGHPNDATLWYFIGGIVAAVVGLVLLVRRGR
jgi:hypothetical protein